MLFGGACKLLILWSGRRDSNPRRPAWENGFHLNIKDLGVHGVFSDSTKSLDFNLTEPLRRLLR